MAQGGKGGNIYDQSANALSGSLTALQNAGNFFNQNFFKGAAPTATPAMVAASTASPALGSASTAIDPARIAAGIGGYMNPYTTQVINRTANDIGRMNLIQQAQNAAGATAANAFGGGRHGLVEAVTNAESQRALGDVAANLRHAGFETAAGLSAQDIQNLQQNRVFNAGQLQQMGLANQANQQQAGLFNAGQRQQAGLANQANQQQAGIFNAGQRTAWEQARANQALAQGGGLAGLASQAAGTGATGFNIGQSITGNQAQQGQLQQALAQAVMDLGSGQYQDYMNQPQNILDMLLSATGMSPLNQQMRGTNVTRYQPGLFDWASLIGGSYYGSRGR